MIKAVIFDMDGVLIDTEKWLNIYWQQAAKEAGFHFTREHGLAIRSLATKYTGPICKRYLDRNLIMKRSGRDANSS